MVGHQFVHVHLLHGLKLHRLREEEALLLGMMHLVNELVQEHGHLFDVLHVFFRVLLLDHDTEDVDDLPNETVIVLEQSDRDHHAAK